MLILKRLALGVAVLVVLGTQTACVTMQTKEDVGRVLGAVGGIGLGSLFGKGDGRAVMMAIGGIAGYVIGGNVGKSMDREDQERAGSLARRSFDEPRPVEYRDTWHRLRYRGGSCCPRSVAKSSPTPLAPRCARCRCGNPCSTRV